MTKIGTVIQIWETLMTRDIWSKKLVNTPSLCKQKITYLIKNWNLRILRNLLSSKFWLSSNRFVSSLHKKYTFGIIKYTLYYQHQQNTIPIFYRLLRIIWKVLLSIRQMFRNFKQLKFFSTFWQPLFLVPWNKH